MLLFYETKQQKSSTKVDYTVTKAGQRTKRLSITLLVYFRHLKYWMVRCCASSVVSESAVSLMYFCETNKFIQIFKVAQFLLPWQFFHAFLRASLILEDDDLFHSSALKLPPYNPCKSANTSLSSLFALSLRLLLTMFLFLAKCFLYSSQNLPQSENRQDNQFRSTITTQYYFEIMKINQRPRNWRVMKIQRRKQLKKNA